MASNTGNFNIRLGIRDEAVVRRALENLGASGERALQRLDREARRASSGGFRAFQGAMRETEALGAGFAARLGLVGRALAALGPVGIAAGVAAAGVGTALTKSIRAGIEFERQQLRINALLATTRQASGQTAASIEALANQIGRATLASTKEVRDAAAALLTFRSVSGEAFGRTLRLAQDLAEVFGTDLRSGVLQLGKALEDPERNLSQLNRSGISFTQVQIEMIKRLKETGDEAGALGEILKTIEAQVGGAGAQAAGGLAGAWDNLTESMDRALERLDRFIGLSPALAAAANRASAAIDSIREATPSERAAGLRAGIAGRRAEIERLGGEAGGLGGLLPLNRGRIAALEAATAKDVAALNDVLRLQAEAARAREGAAVMADIASAARKDEVESAERAKAIAEDDLRLNKERAAELKRQVALIGQLADDEAKRAGNLKDFIAGAERELALAKLTGTERAVQESLMRAQAIAGRELTEAERARLRVAIEQTEEIEKQRAAARRAAEEMARVIGRSTDRIVDFGADAFDRILQGGRNTFAQLGADILAIMRRTFAQLAAEAIIRPIVQPLIAGAVGAAPGLFGLSPAAAFTGGAGLPGGGGAIGALGRFGLGPIFEGLNTAAASAFPGVFGLSGQSLATALTLNPGTASGALAAFGGAGPSVAGVGGALSFSSVALPLAAGAALAIPLLGGLFGNKKPSNRAAVGQLTFGAGGITGTSLSQLSSATGQTIGARDQIIAETRASIERLLAAADATGVALAARTIDVGVRDGLQILTADRTLLARLESGNVAGAVAFLTREAAGGLRGASPLVTRAARRSARLGSDPNQLLSDIALARSIEDARRNITDLAQSIRELGRQAAETATRARALGLPSATIRRGFVDAASAQVGAFFGGLLDPLRAARAGIAGLTQAPGDRLSAAQAEATRLFGLAQGGNLAAIRAFPGAASAVVQLGAESFGPAGPAFAALAAEQQGRLDSLIARIEGDRDRLQTDFGLRLEDAIERQTATLAEEVRALRIELARAFERLERAEASPTAQRMARSVQLILSRIDRASTDVTSGPARLDPLRAR